MTVVIVRVRDRPDSLERIGGMLRRRAFAVDKISCSTVDDNTLEFVIRVRNEADTQRLCHEMEGLHDVVSVRSAGSATNGTKEFLLARLSGTGPDNVFEMIGSPEEIDGVLAQLRAQNIITAFARSGEVAMPPSNTPDPEGVS